MDEQQSVVLETSMGDIQLELYWNHAPKVLVYLLFNLAKLTRPQTCKNMAELAKRGYYNGVTFHRIISVGTRGRDQRWESHEVL